MIMHNVMVIDPDLVGLAGIIVPVTAIIAIFIVGPLVRARTQATAAVDPVHMQEVWDRARRLESRIEQLERLLDSDVPGWRSRS